MLKHCLQRLYLGSRSCQIHAFFPVCAIAALIKPFSFAHSFPTKLPINLSSPLHFIPFCPSLLCLSATSSPPPAPFLVALPLQTRTHHLLLSNWTFLSLFTLLSFLCSLHSSGENFPHLSPPPYTRLVSLRTNSTPTFSREKKDISGGDRDSFLPWAPLPPTVILPHGWVCGGRSASFYLPGPPSGKASYLPL